MNKKFLSALLLGALTVTSTGTLVSCKDYDDDITNLQEQIDKNAKAIKEISDLIAKGGVITGTTSVEGGVKVTLSNGNEFIIKNGENGAPGAPGTAWTIGDDGFWYKDGNKTDYKALGKDGEPGPAGPQGKPGQDATASGENGKYYVPNATTGKFDIYKDGKLVESTNISFLGSGVITAVKDDVKKTLTLYGVKGGIGANQAVTISMSGDLSSLVFMPQLYLDGIEMINYPYLTGHTLKKQALADGCVNHDGVTVSELGIDYKGLGGAFNYGPAWAVDYHANPVNANVTYADVAGFNVLNPTVLYTRATAEELGVTSPEKDFGGNQIFKLADNGVLTVGLQVANPEKLNPAPTQNKVTDTKTWNDANTVALQVKNSEGNIVVSDYALLQPTKAKIEGMVWLKNPDYKRAESHPQTGDTDCSLGKGKVHVYDNPVSALADDKRHAALELYYEDNTEINLNDYVGIHLTQENIKDYMKTSETLTLTPAEAKKWGLTFHFIPVMYLAGDNKTSDTHFLKVVGSDDTVGKFRAQNVDENLKEGRPAEASVGREPLVQVLVKNNEGNVVLDGYILIHITKQAKDNHVVENWANQDVQFDQCNDLDVFQTTWEQFNDYILTQQLNMTKNDFDHQYAPDMADAANHKMNMYAAPLKTKGSMDPDNTIGDVFYTGDKTGTTNHTWRWVISADQVEMLLHDKESVTLTRYIRYNAKDEVTAKYPYIYIKMQTTITRKQLAQHTFGNKIAEYWFDAHRVHGTKGVFFDVINPWDRGNINSISRGILTTMDGNNVASLEGKNYKFFFEPKDITLTAQDGKKYTITTSGNGLDHNNIVCHYDNTHKHAYAEFADMIKVCAIDYNSGAFNNKNLYAIKEGTTTSVQIATMDQSKGIIDLVNKEYCQKLLNATGYANLNQLTDELSAHVGVVACGNNCELAEQVIGGSFIVSWQRPINLITREENPVIDANTNGNTLWLADCLKFYDWRGYDKDANTTPTDAACEANQSNMWGSHLWYWAYYGINKIAVDYNNIKTNLGHGNTFVPLKSVTNELSLYCIDKNNNAVTPAEGQKVEFTFDLSSYNSSEKNQLLKDYMKDNKAVFGRIHYTNNGDNVGEFSLQIPVTVGYTWGEFETVVTLKVKRSIGQ